MADQDEFQELIDSYLASHSYATRLAYAADLEDFAGSRGQNPAEALMGLVASEQEGQHLLLTYGVRLAMRQRASGTMRRRLSVLAALTRRAQEYGLASFSLEAPTAEAIEAAREAIEHCTQPEIAYFLPRGDEEIDRLDIQHYALREAFGDNHMAPVRRPERILDVGCGTGQWGFEMCERYPMATVFGLDLVQGKRPWPIGYHLVRGNFLRGLLPFVDHSFDLTHMRLLVSGVPVARWSDVVGEMVRVTRPGAWVEQLEALLVLEPSGPATDEVFGMALRMGARVGLDTEGRVYADLAGYLARAGMTVAGEREQVLPIGEWGGRLGQMMATDVRSGLIRLADTFRAVYGVDEGRFRDLVMEATAEWERYQTTLRFKVVWARKPG